MKVDATVDLGKNVSEMLGALAKSLGITVEKLFPYYVAKIKTEALYSIIVSCVAETLLLLMGLIALCVGLKADDEDIAVGACIIACGCAVFFILVGIPILCNVPSWVTQYINPEPFAVSEMMKALSGFGK